ncbi:MAG: hypothetical protein NT062_30275 [Proteobacteria bacterium]|nr:hypothetical protein [Pseudomonadota bacterium]
MQLGAYEFPTARVHAPPTIADGLRAWFAARWTWLKPRTIPVVVACASAAFSLAAIDYLTELAHGDTAQLESIASRHTLQIADAPTR